MRYRIEAIHVGNMLQNYIWMLVDQTSQEAVCIDPTQADLVLSYCEQYHLRLSQIWITHKHGDHIGGIVELKAKTHALIYAPALEKDHIPTYDHLLEHEAHFQFQTLEVEVLHTPGHTLGHICYFIDELDALFCGDTLFALGCGRLFEGTYAQMHHSLQRLAALPPRTQVFCTHEYTESNAKFAITVEPDNIALQRRFEDIKLLRQRQHITLPSTIELELQTNPFLRCQSVEEFQKIRELKDHF